MIKLDLFNKKKIKKLEDDIFSLQRDLITEQNKSKTYKDIIENCHCSTLLLEENKKLIEWVERILEEFGTIDVYERHSIHIPIYRKTDYAINQTVNEFKRTKTEIIVIPEIVIQKKQY